MSTPFKIYLYPNPSRGKVTVHLSEQIEAGSIIEILDISGRKIASRLISNNSEVFNLDNQPSGLYFIKVTNGSNWATQKMVLK